MDETRPRPRPRPLPPRPVAPTPEPPVARFVPDRRYTALAAGGALGALLAVLITDDAGGRLLAGLAGLMLVAYVVTDLVFSPRVVANRDGIVVRAPLTRARVPWSEVGCVRAETRFRYGVRSTTLEIDAGPVLVVLSHRALGADPVDAAALIEAFRPVTR